MLAQLLQTTTGCTDEKILSFMQMLTDDIKGNRLWLKRRTTLEDILKIAVNGKRLFELL